MQMFSAISVVRDTGVIEIRTGEMDSKFELIKKTEIKDQNGILHEYADAVTGAKLFYLETSDTNKLFSVSFKTVPEDSTGVFHILEHSVLCGSEKYPVKDPFLELAKGSMYTFLNAMTFPDHTSYPVSSRNEKDFLNLVSVYLDAVFNPAIYQNKNIFYQEGWHYEVAEDGENAFVNGVVYNEMKGVESSVDSKMMSEMMKLLYPDTCYRHQSGGDSKEIPELTYEQFIETHHRFYRPDNACFYLEGKIDLQKTLELIESYLRVSEEPKNVPEIEVQKEVPCKAVQITYPLGKDEESENRVQLLLGKRFCDYSDRIKAYAAMILSEFLTGSFEAPLTQLVFEESLGQDVRMMLDNSIRQPYLLLQLVNTEETKKEHFFEILEMLKEELISSVDLKDYLEPIITNLEFKSGELEEPRALTHSMNVVSAVLYETDVTEILSYRELFKELRRLLETDYYEKLLAEILDPNGYSSVTAIPVYETDDEASFVPATDAIRDQNEKLIAWQMTPDSRESIEMIPRIQLSDVDKQPKENPFTEVEMEGVKVLIHSAPISEMAYVNLYFPVPCEYADRLSEVSLLANMFLNLPTVHYDVVELYRKMKSVIGELQFEYVNTSETGKSDVSTTYLAVRLSYLKTNAIEAVKFLSEVLFSTVFEEKTNAENVLLQLSDAYRNSLIENGDTFASMQALSSWSSAMGAEELLEGISCYETIKRILEEETGVEEFLKFMNDLRGNLLTRSRLIVGITVPEGEATEEISAAYGVDELLKSIPNGPEKDCKMSVKLERRNREFPIPSMVSYAAAGIHGECSSMEDVGVWRVAANIISLEYLWTEIRMRGGAYGAGMSAGFFGDISFFSYRDPDAENSLHTFKTCSEFLKEFAESDEPLDSYIIGAIAKTEPLLGPKYEAIAAEKDYLCNLSYQSLCDVRKGMIGTTREQLLKIAEELVVLEKELTTCVIKQS